MLCVPEVQYFPSAPCELYDWHAVQFMCLLRYISKRFLGAANLNLMKNVCCSNIKNINDPSRPQSYTCHDSWAVVTCAKLWPDWMIKIKTRAKRISQNISYELIDSFWNGFLVAIACYWKGSCDTYVVHRYLTHWCRATYICVGKLTIIGSDKGLSPGRRQAIIWTNA